MERLRSYVNRGIDLGQLRPFGPELTALGFQARYVPAEPDIFDEFDFGFQHDGCQVALLVAVERGVVRRIFFGLVSPADPDALSPLGEAELASMLEARGGDLVRFLDLITCPETAG